MSLTGIGQALSTNYEMFVAFAFLNAIGVSGLYPLAFVLGLEMVGKRKRGTAGMVCNYFYALGVAGLGAAAWIYNDWILLQLLISIPPMILFVYYWIVPESVRWLLTKGKNRRAIKIIKNAAKTNGVQISEPTLKMFQQLENEEREGKINKTDTNKGEILAALKVLLTSKVMLIRTMILLYNFGVNALVYFGLSLNSVSLSGNQYFNFVLVSLIEIPGYWLGLHFIEKYGRVTGFLSSMILCGITCIACGYAETVWIQIGLFLIGKLGITCSFSIIYVHATELMPTVIRSSCIGFFATMARVGALASPFAPFLEKYYKPLPYIVFGVTAIVGGIMALHLPETLNRKLPNTIEEASRIEFKHHDDEDPLEKRDGLEVIY